MTELSNLDALVRNQDAGAPLVLKHPVTLEPIGITLNVLGEDSDKIRKLKRRQLNMRLKNQQKKLTAEELESNTNEIYAAAITGWEWEEGVTLDGERPECTPDNVSRFLNRFLFAKKQVDDHMADTSAFLSN